MLAGWKIVISAVITLAAMFAADVGMAEAGNDEHEQLDRFQAVPSDQPGNPRNHASTRDVSFTTDEGTWMSVDVSPDGRSLVFDLLGQLYLLPIYGGVAKPLDHHEWAWDTEPRFSPDGSRVLFLSDRAGVRDLWVLDLKTGKSSRMPGGDDPEHATLRPNGIWHPGAVVHGPRWLNGGRGIAMAMRQTKFDGVRYRTQNMITGQVQWARIPLARPGRVSTTPVTKDGRTLYFSVKETAGKGDSSDGGNHRLYQIDVLSGNRTQLTDPLTNCGDYAPELSHSGRLLAYGRFCGFQDVGRSELRLKDLVTGQDRLLAPLVGVDAPSQYSLDMERPTYAFTPDDDFIVLWMGGKLHKVEVATGTSSIIPFTAHVRRQVRKPLEGHFPLNDGPVEVNAQRYPSLSNDQKTLVFAAVGEIWLRQLPDGAPQRLTNGAERGELATMPALSPDGTRIAYVAFSKTPSDIVLPGQLRILRIADRRVEPVLKDGASYALPRWSPDGTRLAVIRAEIGGKSSIFPVFKTVDVGWTTISSPAFQSVATLSGISGIGYHVSLVGDLLDSLSDQVPPPTWSVDGQKLLLQRPRETGATRSWVLQELTLDGHARDLAVGEMAIYTSDASAVKSIVPSPDGERVLLIGKDQQAYIANLSEKHSKPTFLSPSMPELRRIGKLGALHPYWQSSDRLIFGAMDRVFTYTASDDELVELARTSFTVPRYQGRGTFAIRNARLITVSGENGAGPVIERGTLVVQKRRIAAVGPTKDIKIPADAHIIDGTGFTIMPGIVDVHYHGIGATRRSGPSLLDRALAYGVTTAFQAGGNNGDWLAEWRALRESGRMRGPRYFFDNGATYSINVNSARAETPLEQIRTELHRKRMLGTGPCLKSLPKNHDRKFSRMLGVAAYGQRLCIVGHSYDMQMNLTFAMDGAAPHHWNTPRPLYRDVVQFLTQSRTTISPHFVIGPLWREIMEGIHRDLPLTAWKKAEYWHGSGNAIFELENDPQVSFADSREGQTVEEMVALMQAGVRVAISGDHAHATNLRAEMRLFQRAGATPEDILRSVTMTNAEELGLAEDIGSLEPGKIADFLVLTANPMDDVLNSILIKWTVIDGVIYDSETLGIVRPSVDTRNLEKSESWKEPNQSHFLKKAGGSQIRATSDESRP